MEVLLEENERIDDLEFNDLKVIQNNQGFCFGIDSVLLSDFAKDIKQDSFVLDLGTGTGVISVLLCGKTKLKKIVGVEIQEEVAKMAKKTSILNNLEGRFEVLNDNILNLKNIYENQTFDAIVTNPPYKKKDTGIINENEKKMVSRHEITATLEDFIRISRDLLKDKGTFYMVHRPERLADIISLMRLYKLEPRVLRFVSPSLGKAPNLVLIKGIKNAKPFLKVESDLIVYDSKGNYTREILEIYNRIKK